VKAFAIDTAGNMSATSSVSFLYITSDTLVTRSTGLGTITRDMNGKLLEIGQNYTLTAKPGTGCIFSNWVNGSGVTLTNSAALKFTMQSNLVLIANFVPNPFLSAAGNYAGLFYDTHINGLTVSNAGLITVTLTSSGGFTAKLRQGAASYSLSGAFSPDGTWSANSIKGTPGWGITLRLLDGQDAITGKITHSAWTAEVTALHAAYSKTNLSLNAGQYTLVIPGSDNPLQYPGGHGGMAVNVTTLGAVAVAGALGDGEPVIQTTSVSCQGQWPLYAAPYSKKGLLIGWMTFNTNAGVDYDLTGSIRWIKPVDTKLYPNGFNWPCRAGTNNALGSAFSNSVPLLDWSSGVVILSDGNLANGVTNGLSVGNGKMTGTNGSTLKITTTGVKAGLFSGSVKAGTGSKATRTVSGAFLQKQNAGYGWFLDTNQSGSVQIKE
jgi:hypothetical protein